MASEQQQETHHGSTNQRHARVDGAVRNLMQMQKNGQLPGRLYGRMSDLAYISQAEAATAVNAVLVDACNLVTAVLSELKCFWLHACLLRSLTKGRVAISLGVPA